MPTSSPIAPAVDVGKLAHHLRFSITRLARKLRTQSRAGLSPTLMAALATIETHGPMTPGDLAQHEQIQKPTVTRILGSLLEQSLVSRSPDPLDGRVAWIRITPAGRKLLQRVRRRHDEYVAQRLASLDVGDLATLERAAEILDHITERQT